MSSPRTPGSDAFSDPQGQPSEEEMRAYVQQLRDSDPMGILVQAYQVLGTGAEVKLGRSDARVLIDAMGGLVSAIEGRVDEQLAQQMKAGVGQLQNAQVQAEVELRQQAGAGQGESQGKPQEQGQPQPSGAAGGQGSSRQETGAGGGPAQPGQGAGPGGQSMTDRLWIPGRDPGPPQR